MIGFPFMIGFSQQKVTASVASELKPMSSHLTQEVEDKATTGSVSPEASLLDWWSPRCFSVWNRWLSLCIYILLRTEIR